jgi:hypothetical protein
LLRSFFGNLEMVIAVLWGQGKHVKTMYDVSRDQKENF